MDISRKYVTKHLGAGANPIKVIRRKKTLNSSNIFDSTVKAA
jgi:hypothetical protein